MMVEDIAMVKAGVSERTERKTWRLTRRLSGYFKSRQQPPASPLAVPVNLETPLPIPVAPVAPSQTSFGSIEFKNFDLDLRQFIFPFIFSFLPKFLTRLRPGSNLILSPVTTTVEGSFSRYDILNSFLLDKGLRLLVGRALRLRVRSVRDLFDGALFYGRTWDLSSPNAPEVTIPKLINVEFDSKDRAIITGRAKIRAAVDSPVIENGFKLRTRLGTSGDGRYIKLMDPELAIVLECPAKIEELFTKLKVNWKKPAPVVIYVPLTQALKLTQADRDREGFDLGEDNKISDLWIENGALRFKLSAILRPGKFLGNNYLAFSVPIRTFIVTLERVKNGVRAARANKRKTVEEENKARAAVAQAEKERKSFTYDYTRLQEELNAQAVEREKAGVNLGEKETTFWTYLENFEGVSVSFLEFFNRRKRVRESGEQKKKEAGGVKKEPVGGEEKEQSIVSKFLAGFSGQRIEERGEILGLSAIAEWASEQLEGEKWAEEEEKKEEETEEEETEEDGRTSRDA